MADFGMAVASQWLAPLQQTADAPVHVIFGIVAAAPLLPMAVALSGLWRYHRRHGRSASSLENMLWISLALSTAFYGGLLVYAFYGPGTTALATFPLSATATFTYAMFGLAVVAFLGVDQFARRVDEEQTEALLDRTRMQERHAFRSRLLRTASHELNTPLTPIKAELDLLASGLLGDLNDEQRSSVTVIQRNTERLNRLVRDILEVSRIEAGFLPINPKRTALRPLVEETVQTYRSTALGKGVTLTITGADDADAHVDPARLQQVLHNLVSNAIKFTPQDGRIETSLRLEGSEAVIRVRDTGMGMDAAQVERLFEPFGQVHHDYPQGIYGTGLGLYICKVLVDEQGGAIKAESEGPGKGSTFVVRLPVMSGQGEGA